MSYASNFYGFLTANANKYGRVAGGGTGRIRSRVKEARKIRRTHVLLKCFVARFKINQAYKRPRPEAAAAAEAEAEGRGEDLGCSGRLKNSSRDQNASPKLKLILCMTFYTFLQYFHSLKCIRLTGTSASSPSPSPSQPRLVWLALYGWVWV